MTNEEASRRLDCMDRFLKTRYNDYSERDHDAFLLAIKALENERPHGKWIDHKDWYRYEECPWECSECGTCSDNNTDFCGECVVRLGGMTDCFAPVEKDHRITYNTIKELNKRDIPYLIVTKSPLVADYADIMRKDLAHIQITVTCLDDHRYKMLNYEKAPLPSVRITAAERLQERGFDVSLRLSPFIPVYPFWAEEDYARLSQIKVDKVLVEFLRVNSWVKKWFKNVDFAPYTVKQGGYRHLPLNDKKSAIKPILAANKTVTVCEDEDEAYEYWKNAVNPNKKDCCNLRRITNADDL